MTDQNAREVVPVPTRTAERGGGVRDVPKGDQKGIQAEIHRMGVEAVARALDQAV